MGDKVTRLNYIHPDFPERMDEGAVLETEQDPNNCFHLPYNDGFRS